MANAIKNEFETYIEQLVDTISKDIFMEEHIRMLEESLPHAEEYEEELKAMKKAFEEKRDSIPYLIRDYYDMNYSITKR